MCLNKGSATSGKVLHHPNTCYANHAEPLFTEQYRSSSPNSCTQMATPITKQKSPTSASIKTTQDHDFVPLMHGHVRGHGSFSASTIRSPTAPATSNGLDIVGQTALFSTDIADNESAIQTPTERVAVHQLNATGSVQAVVVDDDVLFAGLQGGEIVVWFLCH
jgi:hypothetical protein